MNLIMEFVNGKKGEILIEVGKNLMKIQTLIWLLIIKKTAAVAREQTKK